jgi:hypothetical protein
MKRGPLNAASVTAAEEPRGWKEVREFAAIVGELPTIFGVLDLTRVARGPGSKCNDAAVLVTVRDLPGSAKSGTTRTQSE